MSMLDRLAISCLPLVPRPIMRALSSRYIAGEELSDALARLTHLQARGHPGIIDLLGEEVTSESEARAVAQTYMQATSAVKDAGLDAYVSIKPTHLGLRLSEELALELYRQLADHCAKLGEFLRVEMEDHTNTDDTLDLFRRLRADWPNVGIVLQSRLFRTMDDIDALEPEGLDVRMVKGIYIEPAEIAHLDPDPIRDAFYDQCKRLWERGANVALGTHDDALADRLIEYVRAQGLGPDRYEFQVLLGVQEPLWKKWREAGHRVRVYVPYGPQWRPYSSRRLKKNPQIFRHVMRDMLHIS